MKLTGLRRRWEALCRGCGDCCFEKEYSGGRLFIYPDRPCPFLDTESRRCTVYNDRFTLNPDCSRMTIFRAMFARWLPEECGYVQWAKRNKLRFW